MLNDTTMDTSNKYIHETTQSGAMIDLVLEYNKDPYCETIGRGIPAGATYKTSDHLPYCVKVRFKGPKIDKY